MCKKWLLLMPALLIQLAIVSCRKHKTISQVIIPDTPGSVDTTPNPQNPGNNPITYIQNPVHVRIGDNVGGYYEALPPDYPLNPEKEYPLLIFLHGGGEMGDGSEAMLHLITKNALTSRLQKGDFPAYFTVNNQTFSFIIISPQFAEWPSDDDVHDVLTHALTKYRIDSSRIYLSGLSMGGGATWEFAGSKYGSMLAAIVPICGASWADSAVAKQIAYNEIPAWAFHNEDDQAVTINSTKRYARLIAAENPKYPVKVTYWPTGGHDAWTKASDPEYREDGKNMYEWMLQYVR